MKRTDLLIFAGLCVTAGIFAAGPVSTVSAKEAMEVVRDKDKTSYVIGSNEEAIRQEERDKERAWRMLENSNMWIDKRTGRPVAPATNQ